MQIKGLVDEDFINYKLPSMFLIFPYCSFKCDNEFGCVICQNSALVNERNIDIPISTIIQRYINNPLTESLCCGGLEPFDSFEDLLELVDAFRKKTQDDIVIYTGYKEEEIIDKVNILRYYNNIVIKFGRYIPDQDKHYDEVLGVYLASDNQYGRRI